MGITGNLADFAAESSLLSEFGTWTPTLSQGSATFTECEYYKVGRQVTVTGRLYAFTDRTTLANIIIGGIPFTKQDYGTAAVMFRNISDGENGVYIYGNPGEDELYLLFSGTNGAWASVNHDDLNSSSSEIRFTITYLTD